MADNNVTMVGNLTREPELRYTQGGKAVTSFGMAVSRRYQQNGDWKEQTEFFNVTCWDTMGENVAASLKKGSRVIVTGRIEIQEYEGRDNETKRSINIVADEVGASMRWARVEIERTEREKPAERPRQQQRREPDPVYGDEEPF